MSTSGGELSLPEIAALTGVIVIVVGLLVWFANGIVQMVLGRVLTVMVPSSPRAGQSICVFGILLLAVGALMLAWPAGRIGPPGAAPPSRPVVPPSASGTTSPQPSEKADPSPAQASAAGVRITSPDGATDMGHDVVATGTVGTKTFACFAVGWYVQTTEGWTAYYVKTAVSPDAHGSFRTPVLQMGSPGETGSSWFPFLLGATPSGCAWLHQLWERTPTGEYHGDWPPPGSTVLYSSATAIHRTF